MTTVTTLPKCSQDLPFDLANVNLRGSDMSGLVAKNAYLLTTDFDGVTLTDARFTCTDLTKATFDKVDLGGVTFAKVLLDGADF